MKIYDTLTKTLQDFKPLHKDQVSFYQCGPTVYSRQHIGNLFSVVKGDFIRRALLYMGYSVKYVRNITDVGHLVSDQDQGEDKMLKGATREGLTPQAIAQKYTDLFHEDLKRLEVLDPDFEPAATKYIDQMAQMVQLLIDKGYAYATNLAIYFDVSKFKNYNDLNRQNLEKNLVKAGHGEVGDSDKKNPYDFAIWFFKTGAHQNAIQVWPKRFNNIEQIEELGFPGWHIECSAMSKAILGDTIDIHMGGMEHIAVHHTNEIAQSEAANGVKFVNYWLHHEWLLVDGTKMSKSLGNIYTIDQLIEKGFDPLDFRYFLLQAHYRSKQNFTWQALTSAQAGFKNLKNKVSELLKSKNSDHDQIDEQAKHDFKEALFNDFNLPQALAIVMDLLNNKYSTDQTTILNTIFEFDKVLGLNLIKLEEDIEIALPDEIKELLNQRQIARDQKNWSEADRLRDLLKTKYKLVVMDGPQGQQVKTL